MPKFNYHLGMNERHSQCSIENELSELGFDGEGKRNGARVENCESTAK